MDIMLGITHSLIIYLRATFRILLTPLNAELIPRIPLSVICNLMGTLPIHFILPSSQAIIRIYHPSTSLKAVSTALFKPLSSPDIRGVRHSLVHHHNTAPLITNLLVITNFLVSSRPHL
jgi:hypothetical protein